MCNVYITNSNMQFLLCLEEYVNKTSRSAAITSYSSEPFLLVALHLKKSVQEQSGAWLVQECLPNLEAASPTKKKKKYLHSMVEPTTTTTKSCKLFSKGY
jgi:hypothetical protein